jgi:branched-chain amino acid transport system substrate-binding protein
LLFAAPALAADYQINVILPMTGGGSFVGQGQQGDLDAVANVIDKAGGINGRNVRFVYHDDQTSPQLAVQLTSRILGSKPTVILGSSLVAMCRAMAPLMKNGPVQFCLSAGMHPAPGSYSFSSNTSSTDQIAATVRYLREKGWTRLATLETTDSSGQDGDEGIKNVLARPENRSMRLVAFEHFNPTDVSVSAQIERIKQAGAQALISWSTGAPVATVFKGMIQGGLDIPVAPTSANATFSAMSQWQDFLPKQLVLPAPIVMPHAGVYKLDPRVEKAQADMYAALAERKLQPDGMVATCWDAALIVADGLRKIGPNGSAQQLRDYIANLQDFAGVDGIYDFKKYPERGIGEDSAVITRYDIGKKAFVWVSKPGGEPLDR